MLRVRIYASYIFLLSLYYVTVKIDRHREIKPMYGFVTATMVIDVKITSKSVLYLQIQNTLCKIGKEPILLACRFSC